MTAPHEALRAALRPFAEMALRFGQVYLDERQKELGDNPYNMPHNYSTAVMRAAENTSWADWRRALEAYENSFRLEASQPTLSGGDGRGCKMAWKQGFCYGDPEYCPAPDSKDAKP